MRRTRGETWERHVAFDPSSRPLSTEHTVPVTTLRASGDAQELAHDVEVVSPEGAPADPHSGPGGQLAPVFALALVFVAAAVAMGFAISWYAAAATIGLGLAAMMFNPTVFAAMFRAGDRREVMEHRPASDEPTDTKAGNS